MSDFVATTIENNIATITFNNPPFNLLDLDSMGALIDAHAAADANEDVKVIVTRSGIEGMYSNGVNPAVILEGDQAKLEATFAEVGRLVHTLYSMNTPHITVVNGPAMAGGAVLAVLADWRYFIDGAGEISFAEVKVGIPLPGGVSAIIRQICQPSALNDVVLGAGRYDAQAAKEIGLCDVVAPAGEIDSLVTKHAGRLCRVSRGVVRETKAQLRAATREVTARMTQGDMSSLAPFLGAAYLGEGVTAFIEGRRPVFAK